MLKTVEGIYREGKIELLETPNDMRESRVIVTFLPTVHVHGPTPPLTEAEAVELRSKLAAWEEDWNAPGMEAYDEL